MPRLESPEYNRLITSVRDRLHSIDPALAALLESTAHDTLQRAVVRMPTTGDGFDSPEAELITGDIPAMWLRDAVVQLEPLMVIHHRCPVVQELVRGVVWRLSRAVVESPYANAVTVSLDAPARERLLSLGVDGAWLDGESPHAGDELPPEVARTHAWEVKWEVDSIGWYLRLLRRYITSIVGPPPAKPLPKAEKARRMELLDQIVSGIVAIGLCGAISVLRIEQDMEGNEGLYRFHRPGGGPLDQVPEDRVGPYLFGSQLVTGAFRPSDDRMLLPIHLPANILVGVELQRIANLISYGFRSDVLEREAIRTGPVPDPSKCMDRKHLAAHARDLSIDVLQGVRLASLMMDDLVLSDPRTFGWMRGLLPYEWDGGDRLLLDDDANVPGLLSLGWLGMADLQGDPEIHGMMKSFGFESAKLDPALFVAGTRAFSLSSNNGQFVPLRGKKRPLPGVPESVPGGLGSEHTPTGMLWPMSLAVASLGEADRDRRMDWLRALAALCPDGQCHESVNPQDPREFTREWFAMGNALTALALIRGVEPEVTEQPEFPGLDIG